MECRLVAQFKEKVIRKRLAASRNKSHLPEPEPEVQVAESKLRDRHMRFQQVNMMLFSMVQELVRSETMAKPLQVDKFMEASNRKIRSKQLLEDERKKEEESAVQQERRQRVKDHRTKHRHGHVDEADAVAEREALKQMHEAELLRQHREDSESKAPRELRRSFAFCVAPSLFLATSSLKVKK